MKKGYLDDLSEWAGKYPKRWRGSVTTAFMAVKEDVKTGLDAGYGIKMIWRHMQETGRIDCSYKTFYLYTQRYIRQAEDKDDKGQPPNSSSTTETPATEETPEVKIAKGDDSADSEKAELEPWELKFKIAEEKIAAMKKKHPNLRIDPKPIPENDKALAKKEILPVAKSDGQEQKKETETEIDDDPWAERMQKLREVREKHKIKSFQWNPVPMTMAEIIRGKRDDPKDKSQKEDSQASKDQKR